MPDTIIKQPSGTGHAFMLQTVGGVVTADEFNLKNTEAVLINWLQKNQISLNRMVPISILKGQNRRPKLDFFAASAVRAGDACRVLQRYIPTNQALCSVFRATWKKDVGFKCH